MQKNFPVHAMLLIGKHALMKPVRNCNLHAEQITEEFRCSAGKPEVHLICMMQDFEFKICTKYKEVADALLFQMNSGLGHNLC